MGNAIGWIAIAAIAMSCAWCTVEQGREQKTFAMQKAAYCSDSGGIYDFTWSTCSMPPQQAPQ